jgi:hypothetical protein
LRTVLMIMLNVHDLHPLLAGRELIRPSGARR